VKVATNKVSIAIVMVLLFFITVLFSITVCLLLLKN
jgi:hypothetical protein